MSCVWAIVSRFFAFLKWLSRYACHALTNAYAPTPAVRTRRIKRKKRDGKEGFVSRTGTFEQSRCVMRTYIIRIMRKKKIKNRNTFVSTSRVERKNRNVIARDRQKDAPCAAMSSDKIQLKYNVQR